MVIPSDVDHLTRWARLQNRPKNDVYNRRDAGKEQRHQRHDPPQAGHVEIKRVRQPSAHARDHLLVATSVQIAHTEYYTILVCRRADQPTDNRANRRRAKGNPSGIATVMVGVMNDMMPRRRWRRAMRTMPSVMRRGNRRTSRQRQTREKNRNRLDGLVHITPSLSV